MIVVFCQVCHPGMEQGTRLGLATARRLCRLLGGEVSVDQCAGAGLDLHGEFAGGVGAGGDEGVRRSDSDKFVLYSWQLKSRGGCECSAPVL